MRIAVISATARRKGIPEYTKALVKGIQSLGHRVDILDAWVDDGFQLPGYEYIVVCAETASFWGGKIPSVLAKILGAGSGLVGKKSAAFLKKTSPLFVNRSLLNLMQVMEGEGMIINWSEILLNDAQAEAMGKSIGA